MLEALKSHFEIKSDPFENYITVADPGTGKAGGHATSLHSRKNLPHELDVLGFNLQKVSGLEKAPISIKQFLFASFYSLLATWYISTVDTA